ncbi:MAG: NosD domain-containing protein [Candidatus Hermodarchaeota archaeon]|nr:NosD domain-containing protein [Candidatus Hermodarchaeota archaeon]
MARTWRNGFVLFVILLILTTLCRVISPSHEFGADTHRLHSSRVKTGYEGHTAKPQNVSLSHQPFMSSFEEQNRFGDWSRTKQTTTYSKIIRSPAPLQPHSPIEIRSDADFANQGWPGNGTQEHPYVIRDLNIAAGPDCILIMNTRVHFVIADCWMERSQIGIYLENVANGFIANTTCVTYDYGVRLVLSESIELFNNTCINTDKGISVRDSNSIMIINNTCFNADFGLWIFDSFSSEIINNTIENSRYFGCEIYPVNDNILVNNSLVNCGFFFGSWEEMSGTPTMGGVGSTVDVNAQIIGNTVNERPLLLWVGRVDFTVPLGAGQVILLNCSIVTVKDQNITDASIGIFLCFTSRSRVFNNTCTDHSVNGIRVQNCEYITVNNNLCTNNALSGITLDQTWDTGLIGNQCNNNSWWGCGIRLFESYDNELLNNTCNHNRYGILLETASGNQLLNNTCNHNQELWWGWPEPGLGILIYGDENTVRWNHCTGNRAGIEIVGQDNDVVENTCTNNSYGIFLQSNTTPISHNLCVNNTIGIYIYGYRDIVINNNTMIGCGLYIQYHGREWIEPVDISDNTVNGQPLVFLKNRVNMQVRSNAGQIILFNCRGITVRRQTLVDCSYGLLVYCTNHSLFMDNRLGNNERHGIFVRDSHWNHFTRNSFSNNDGYGIYLHGSCQYNIVDWNIFLCNASHDACDNGPEFQTPGANIIDCNYWTNYSGDNIFFYGFGDIPYNISGSAGNRDLHPLITPISVLVLQSADRLLFLLEAVVILVIVLVVVVFIRANFRRHPSSSASYLRKPVKQEKR